MAWTITLIVNDKNTNDPIDGVQVFDLVVLATGFPLFTDANGQVDVAFDDFIDAYTVKLIKTTSTTTAAHGYITRNHTFNKVNNGDTETVLLSPAPPPDATGEGSDVCFIVTAATGSPVSAEVVALRAARGRVAGRSALAAQLIERVYEEYASFSPPLADRLRNDPAAREKVLRLVVRPLVTWYQLAIALAFQHEDRTAVALARAAHLEAREAQGGAGSLAAELARLGEPGDAAKDEGDQAYLPLAVAAARLDHVRWAIVDPLVAIAGESRDVESAVANWLSNAPVERLAPPDDDDPAELRALARFFDFDPGARQRLGARLIAVWPDLRAELTAAGYDVTAEMITE